MERHFLVSLRFGRRCHEVDLTPFAQAVNGFEELRRFRLEPVPLAEVADDVKRG